MHLHVRVPNTWYRAALEWHDRSDPHHPHRLIGITLPGVPAMVVGSNTHVAWGFTNVQGDWSDLVLLELDPSNQLRYRTPDGWRTFDRQDEVIEVAGRARRRRRRLRWTIWGPVIGTGSHGPAARTALGRTRRRTSWRSCRARSKTARTIEEAFDAVNGLGTPGQNFVVADDRAAHRLDDLRSDAAACRA